jgi:predicted permease
VDPGFRSDHLLAMQVPQAAIPASTLRQMSIDQQRQILHKQSLQFEQIAERIKNLPGVARVGGIDVLPLTSSTLHSSRFAIEGQPVPQAGARPAAELRTISVGYFSAVGIPLIEGRLFNEDDWGLPRVVINARIARRFWPGGDPLAKRINLCSLAPKPCWFSIIGVVGDLHQFGLDATPTFDVYRTGGWTPYFVVRTVSDPLDLAAEAKEQVHEIDPSLPVVHIMTMDELIADSVSPQRFSTLLLSIFASLALVLSAVGVYGVMVYAVTQRTREIGIRMALGAQRRDIWSQILWQGTKLAFAGVVIGLAGALALTRLLSTLLYGIQPTDPLTFAGVSVLLTIVVIAACYIRARRAMRVDPMVALRYE